MFVQCVEKSELAPLESKQKEVQPAPGEAGGGNISRRQPATQGLRHRIPRPNGALGAA